MVETEEEVVSSVENRGHRCSKIDECQDCFVQVRELRGMMCSFCAIHPNHLPSQLIRHAETLSVIDEAQDLETCRRCLVRLRAVKSRN